MEIKRDIVSRQGGGRKTRPLSARVKTSLFGILSPYLEDRSFYDFFAGNGAVGIEALSRGAPLARFFERDRVCVGIIRENLEKCELAQRAVLHQVDVMKVVPSLNVPEKEPVTAFLGTPYGIRLAHSTLTLLGRYDPFAPSSLVVAEVRKNEFMKAEYGRYSLMRDEYYGDTRLAFFMGRILTPLRDERGQTLIS